MVAEKKILEEIKDLMSIKTMVQTYEEIAASRMQKVKSSVLSNRDFLNSLYGIYQQVKHSYDEELKLLQKEGKKPNLSEVRPRNGKTVAVFLSSNAGLYGDIIRKTFDLFKKSIQGKELDIIIVGKIGQNLFEGMRSSNQSYKYFELADTASTSEEFSGLISYVTEYSKVIVYHGQFQSILSQIPKEEFMSGEVLQADSGVRQEYDFIYEPSIEKVMSFFEIEIMASIFEQSLHESSLSKYASRMISLDRAVVNIGEKIRYAKFTKQRVRHRIINKKQLSLLSSMSLWS
uniref:F0F1 ATP synthase subunit gamma n=1 Tax=candidate division WWE3 bacterium TaxID=2053526 RepID=A0A7C4TPN0_UNCKA